LYLSVVWSLKFGWRVDKLIVKTFVLESVRESDAVHSAYVGFVYFILAALVDYHDLLVRVVP